MAELIPSPKETRLKRVVTQGESTRTECKSQLNLHSKDGRANLAKRIIGLANACKHTSYVVLGAHDDGTPSGIDHTSLTEERLQQIVTEYCEPFVDVALHHIDLRGNPVSVIEIHRRVSDLPYSAAKTQGAGPILEHGFVYFRYGRNTEKAKIAEINALIKEGDRRRRGTSPADDYQYLSLDAKARAMIADLHRAFGNEGLKLPRRTFYHTVLDRPALRRAARNADPILVGRYAFSAPVNPHPPRYRPILIAGVVPAEVTIDDREYILITSVHPEALRANSLEPPFLSKVLSRSPSHRRRLRVVLAHGSVGKPMKPYPLGSVVQREPFGWYVGCSPGGAIRIDAHLFLENVRSAATMEQAIPQLLDWIRTHANKLHFLVDD